MRMAPLHELENHNMYLLSCAGAGLVLKFV